MDITTWIGSLEEEIDRRPGPADRVWAWAYVTRVIALQDILGAPAGQTTDAVWVEPQMAWTLDDLTDAGALDDPLPILAVDPADVPEVLTALLRRVIGAATLTDPTVPPHLVDACTYAIRRACVALHAFAGVLP